MPTESPGLSNIGMGMNQGFNPGAAGGTGTTTQQMPGQQLNPNNMIYGSNNAIQSGENSLLQNTGFNQNQFSSFLNPYVNDVANNMATQSAINFGQNTAPMLQSQIGAGGQFGSARADASMQQAATQNAQNLMFNQSQLMNQGFQNAMQNYGQFQNNAINAAGQMGNLGNIGNNMALSQEMAPLNMLQSIGETGAMQRIPAAQQQQSGSYNPYYMPGLL
jgi:hypothetical protein